MAREAGFTYPVALTQRVWDRFVNWQQEDNKKQTSQDTDGRLWDVLHMLRFAIRSHNVTNVVSFQLMVIPRDGKTKQALTTKLKAEVHGGDKGEPVITIMLPDED